MATASKIETRTLRFIEEYKRLKDQGKMPSLLRLAEIMNINSKSTISEILAQRQNIQPKSWELFRSYFKIGNTEKSDHGNELPSVIDINSDVAKEIGWLKEKLLRAEASVTVLSVTLAEVIAKASKRSIGQVSVELSKAIDAEADRLFAELKRR